MAFNRYKLNWGILGSATIAVEKVIPALQNSRYGRVGAIASRQLSKAQTVADQHQIDRVYDSYEDLLADPAIDAVYLPLPNSLHVPWSVKSLQAGKHVLCEKPLSPDALSAKELVDKARQYPELKIMEAFMYRFHPQWLKVRDLIASGRIGKIRLIHSVFTFFDDNPASIVNKAELGGGSLLDIGCYSISLSRLLFKTEPRRVSGIMETDPRYRIDRLSSAIMAFEQEQTATFTCATQTAEHQSVRIIGTSGYIEMDSPFIINPNQQAALQIQTETGNEQVIIGACDHYMEQVDQFALSVLNQQPVPIPLEEAVANMRVLDSVRESAMTGNWVEI